MSTVAVPLPPAMPDTILSPTLPYTSSLLACWSNAALHA
jgi:hypothetical protein